MIYNAKLICLLLLFDCVYVCILILFFSCFVSFATWLRMSITIYIRLLHNFLFSCLTQIDLFFSLYFFLINLHIKNSIDKKRNKMKKKLMILFHMYMNLDHILNARNVKKKLHLRKTKMMVLNASFPYSIVL